MPTPPRPRSPCTRPSPAAHTTRAHAHALAHTHTHLSLSQKELREIERDTKSGVSVALKSAAGAGGPGSDLTKLTGFVEGPRDTPYEGGYFVVDIELGTRQTERETRGGRAGGPKPPALSLSLSTSSSPSRPLFLLSLSASSSLSDDQYPFAPPRMRFATKVWHPNISSASGAICLDILRDAWSPALTLKTALLSLQSLLASPVPDDPQDAVVAKQYLADHEEWARTAKMWTGEFRDER